MSTSMRVLLATAGVVAIATTLVAQGEKKGSGKGPGILQPQMTVETGSYSAPHGKIGEKPDAPWSATTIGAAVDKKTNPAKVGTLTGEIIDFSCYLQIGKHGEKHRSCGQKCLTAGQPIGLLTSDGTMYMLMEEEHDPRRDGLTDFRKTAIEHMGHIMEVTGTMSGHGGYKAMYVHGYMKQ